MFTCPTMTRPSPLRRLAHSCHHQQQGRQNAVECGRRGLATGSAVGTHITFVVMRKENYVESKNVINLVSRELLEASC